MPRMQRTICLENRYELYHSPTNHDPATVSFMLGRRVRVDEFYCAKPPFAVDEAFCSGVAEVWLEWW